MKTFTYSVKDPLGLHARPAGLLVKTVSGYTSDVKIAKAGKPECDAKRLFGVMGLAVKSGETITITAAGADEDAAIKGIKAFCEGNF